MYVHFVVFILKCLLTDLFTATRSCIYVYLLNLFSQKAEQYHWLLPKTNRASQSFIALVADCMVNLPKAEHLDLLTFLSLMHYHFFYISRAQLHVSMIQFQNMFKKNIFLFVFVLALGSLRLSAAAHAVTTQIFLLQPELPTNAALFSTLSSEWQINAKDVEVTPTNLAFTMPAGRVNISLVSAAMPEKEWRAFADIAWLWKGAVNDMKGHKAYLNIQFTATDGLNAYDSELALAKINASIFHVFTICIRHFDIG